MPASTGRSLPHLLKDQTFSNSPSRNELVRVLRYIDRWREWMYQTWRGEGASNPAEAVDALVWTAIPSARLPSGTRKRPSASTFYLLISWSILFWGRSKEEIEASKAKQELADTANAEN